MGRKAISLLIGDMVALMAASLAANYLRFDAFFAAEFTHYAQWLIINLVVTPLAFYAVGLYRGIWRYASVTDLLLIARAVGARTILLVAIFILLGYDRGLPRSVILIDAMIVFGLVGGVRFVTRMQRELSQARIRKTRRPVLIVGAGDAGEVLLREMRNNQRLDYNPIGFIDDDPAKWGVRIHGVPVLGAREDIPRVASERQVREAVVAIPSATGGDLTEVYKYCQRAGIRTRTLPPMKNLIDGEVHLSQVRDVELEDLLGREPVKVDLKAIGAYLRGKRVIVTGGGGSIGRELARQVAEFQPEVLVIMDRNENNMYFVELELRKRFPELALEAVVADVTDQPRVEEIFGRYRPQTVFHAAAYKHVPLMELNAVEAFKNNILGTWITAREAEAHDCERFVLISTDKAVNPSSIMGATKRVAELVIQGMNRGAAVFVSVRFGNVLGSDGSVVPLFKKQIADGGPVTVTHPEVTRYFMTIPEAVQLVLQAGTMGRGGEIYILDMGQAIKIVDLANNLIDLSGFAPGTDIEIVFTGLRPGEKLHEELHLKREDVQSTAHEKIMRCREEGVENRELGSRLSSLGRSEETEMPLTDAAVRKILSEIVPEFATVALRDEAERGLTPPPETRELLP